ncbi:MAG TPA: Tn3 family transposase [Burkholderiaceae bacterium]|jgi:TnpA family transposase
MTRPSETAYRILDPNISTEEIEKIFALTGDEMKFIQSLVTGPGPQTAMTIHLKMLQRFGRVHKLGEVPQRVRDFLARSLDLARSPTLGEMGRFEKSGGRAPKMRKLREFLDLRPLDNKGFAWLEHVAEQAAEIQQSVADIINVMLEELVRHRYELPAFSTLDRTAFRARDNSNDRYFSAVSDKLDDETKRRIDLLLKAEPGTKHSGWNSVKREPKKPTNRETRIYLEHVEQLKRIVESLPKPDIPVPKLRQFRFLARALDASEMAELKPKKRYALAVVYIRSQYSQALDDSAQLFIRMFRNLENLARNKLIAYQEGRQDTMDMLVGQLKDLLEAYILKGSDNQRVAAMDNSLRASAESLIEECDAQLAYANSNYLPFMAQPYKFVRAQMLNCLLIAEPTSSSDDRSNERFLGLLKVLKGNRQEQIPLAELGLDASKDFAWMSAAWKKLALIRSESGKVEGVERRYLEMAILQMVKDELLSGDLVIKHGEQFSDYREQLVDDETYEEEIVRYAEVTEMEIDPSTFVMNLREDLVAAAKTSDAAFPKNAHVEFLDGRLLLHKPPTSEPDPSVAVLEAEIGKRIEQTGIVDLLISVERWLDLHKMFKPLAGTESRLADLRARVITTLFCFGCNLGPVQTARSMRSLSAKQTAWLNLKYVTEDLLDRANSRIINEYAKFELPSYWGSGEHASADGTKFELYEKNLLSEYHIRYGGYGGIGYYHVSDRYIALMSHFISCGTYEGIHILDYLESNDSVLRPDKLHGDTQAQSLSVFAMAHVLGIELMPRIRGIKDLTFYRPTPGLKLENIDGLFSGSIDWKLIETHLPMMFRIAVSVKLGRITPSTILRRLGTYNRKNKLFFAFQELGKALRTKFLLKYIVDVNLRKFIHAETNKSEQFNRFLKWIFFGNAGIIAENLRHEQQKVIKYNQLVANMVILFNVNAMSQVIRELRAEGHEITEDMLAGVNPYRIGHINLLGDYAVDMRRRVAPFHVDQPILN